MYTVYGIKNCDTVKKATNWLTQHKIPFIFHDYKTEGITRSRLTDWSRQTGWEVLLNKKGTTWRNLDATVKEKSLTQKEAVQLMAAHTSLIKRPVIERDGKVIAVGFDELKYKENLSSKH